MRQYSPLDFVIERLDAGLRTLSGNTGGTRQRPDTDVAEAELSEATKRKHGKLMRVNHTGEICAQALYHGQALTAKTPETRNHLLHAANEEGDHLDWCADRAAELGVKTSILNPLFYAQSFAIGAVAGLAGDKWSFGFITETEAQVYDHLAEHILKMGDSDPKSQCIIEQMQTDEQRHGAEAEQAGGAPLPPPVRFLMKCASKVMTSTTYHI